MLLKFKRDDPCNVLVLINSEMEDSDHNFIEVETTLTLPIVEAGWGLDEMTVEFLVEDLEALVALERKIDG